jgi:hypothetical protein
MIFLIFDISPQTMKKTRASLILVLPIFFFLTGSLSAQSFNHWVRSFNEESSLLAGAVVGGGAGPSAIYYNPASISEIRESKLSVHASLFSYKFFNVKNAIGDNIDMKWSTLVVEPRFLSYMIKPKRSDMSFELAILNNENYRLDVANSVNKEIDILSRYDGLERYFAVVQTQNRFRDDWFGAGWSWAVSPRLFIGISMFVTVKSTEYRYDLSIEAYPLDSAIGIASTDYTTANFTNNEYIKYNDYRLLWKAGIMYKWDRVSIGANFTTPSVGGIYSDGKRVSRQERQSGITDPETGMPLPDYYIGDYQEKKEVKVDHKTPWSIAAGLTFHSKSGKRSLYTTVEYFGGLDPYRIIEANENPDLATTSVSNHIAMNEWLTFLSGAEPVFNTALGYSWIISENLWLMAGFRTDFNYLKNVDFESYDAGKDIKTIGVNNYHFSGGLSWNILGQDLMTGIQYTFGYERDLKQVVNLSDPVEFNYEEKKALQGTRQYNMSAMVNSLSLYIGATFNFGGKKE